MSPPRKKKDEDPTLHPVLLVKLLRKGLNVGIPPTALANMFDLPPEVVKNASITVRRETYGSSELSEVLSFLTWKAIEKQFAIIEHGAPELSLKASQMVLGKALATSVRQTPEEVAMARENLLAVARQDRIIDIEGEELEPQASTFMAVVESTDDQG
jgi:hypothetical protein